MRWSAGGRANERWPLAIKMRAVGGGPRRALSGAVRCVRALWTTSAFGLRRQHLLGFWSLEIEISLLLLATTSQVAGWLAAVATTTGYDSRACRARTRQQQWICMKFDR